MIRDMIVEAWTWRERERPPSFKEGVLILGLFIPSMIVTVVRGLLARWWTIPYSVVANGHVSPASARMAANSAAWMWNKAIGRKVFVPVDSGGLVVEFTEHEDGVNGGQYFPLVSLIKVWGDESLARVLAHEFGHVLGLFHSKEGIMTMEGPPNDLSDNDKHMARHRFGR